MQTLEEGIDLCSHRVRHLVLGHELDVLVLVVVCHGEHPAIGLQVHNLLLPELVTLGRKVQLHYVGDVMVKHPLEVGEVLWVEGLQVSRDNLAAQHVFVEASREPRLEVVAIVDRLADDPPYELEELQVVPVDVRHGVGMVGARLASSLHKESVVGVEDFLGKSAVPLFAHATSVDAFLALEMHLDLCPHLLSGPRPQLVVGVHEDLTAAYSQADGLVAALQTPRAQLRAEVCPLVVKVQALRHVLQQWSEGS
mmetsp:Transcript_63121/g.147016  ORF Transcript_63121/g.147016 Transcript_63121/m.147016 type:complete len:253 (-) Transcript_63121:561-1319(-)